jgi:hypothetical protein
MTLAILATHDVRGEMMVDDLATDDLSMMFMNW